MENGPGFTKIWWTTDWKAYRGKMFKSDSSFLNTTQVEVSSSSGQRCPSQMSIVLHSVQGQH
ncbi:hypothetical protein Q0M56_14210, partial [Staphylococcus aureus]|nr:hypothetical protein [Staphylococcus aureus]